MARSIVRRQWNSGVVEKAIQPALAAAYANPNTGPAPRRFNLLDALSMATHQNGMPGQFQELPRNPLDDGAFGPGLPIRPEAIDPLDPRTGRPEPRVWEYPQSWNLPGNNRREVPWQVLRAAASGVDIIRRCIEVRKAHVASLQWSWTVRADVVEEAYTADQKKGYDQILAELREKYAPDIKRLTARWKKPWPHQDWDFDSWIKSAMEEIVVIDAMVVYPRMSLGGELLDLEQVDGTTIKPLLDWRGITPEPPHPAYQQEVNGFPRGEWAASYTMDANGNQVIDNGFASSEMLYYRSNPRLFTPYGLSAVEQALVSSRLYLKRQGWLLAEYDEGSTPLTWIETPDEPGNNMTPNQRREWERSVNAELGGQEAARHRMKVGAPGWKIQQLSSVDERYKPDFDLHLVKLVAGHFGVTATELGFSETTGLGGVGWQEGQAEVGGRVGLKPDVVALAELINKISTQFCEAPDELVFSFIDPASENDKESDDVRDQQRARATITVNDELRALKLPLSNLPEADMLHFVTPTGPIFLEGSYERAKQAAEAEVEAAKATAEGATGKLELEGAKLEDQKEARHEEQDLQRETRDAEHEFQREQAANVEKAATVEIAAFRTWRKRNPNPKRPFVFKAATPDAWPELGEHGPDVVDFGDGWLWLDDLTKAAKSGMDWRAWNALHPNKPKGPNGRWVKASALGQLLKDSGVKVTDLTAQAEVRRLPDDTHDALVRFGAAVAENPHAMVLPRKMGIAQGVTTRLERGGYIKRDYLPAGASVNITDKGRDYLTRLHGTSVRDAELAAEQRALLEQAEQAREVAERSRKQGQHSSSLSRLADTEARMAEAEAQKRHRERMKLLGAKELAEAQAAAPSARPLTSKVNAHSLTRGDLITLAGKQLHVAGTRRVGDRVQLTVVDDAGNERTITRGLNEPVDRVAGGRAGGSMTKAADPDAPHTGAMVALIPSAADAERLAVEGGEDVDELHLTLAYLGKAADISQGAQRRLVAALDSAVEDAIGPDYDLPVQAEGFAVSIFNPKRPANPDGMDRESCIVLGVGGRDLQPIRNIVLDTVKEVHDFNAGFNLPEQHTPWVPHMTLLYTDDAERVAELTDRTGPITFDRLRIVFAGVATDIPLRGYGSVTKAVEPGAGGAGPKGQTPPPDQRWPGWAQDLAIAAATTAAIQAALTTIRGLTTTALADLAQRAIDWARGWLGTQRPTPGLPAPAPSPRFRGTARVGAEEPTLDLRGWLDSSTDLPAILEDALRGPITDTWLQGYMVGTRSAEAMVNGYPAVDVELDWGGWTPGDVDAARRILAADGSIDGWQAMLRDAGAVIKGVTNSRLKDIAKVLADGLELGLSAEQIGRNLNALLANPAKAYNIAITETNRAMSAAALDTYAAMDVPATNWMNAEDDRVCPICELNMWVAPGVLREVPLGERYPSGDRHPPAHPGGCRCALSPVLDLEILGKALTWQGYNAANPKHTQKGSDGRWKGRGGAVKAVGKKWKAEARQALAHSEEMDDRTKAEIAEVFTGEFGGLRTGEVEVSPTTSLTTVWGGIFDASGHKVGGFSRTIQRDHDGALVVEHEMLKLAEHVQGQGFAEAFNAQLLDWYRQSGVDRIELNANIDVGGYAWARAGYDWKDGHAGAAIYRRLSQAVNPTPPGDDDDFIDDSIENMELIAPERLQEQLRLGREMLERFKGTVFGADDYPLPYEIANLGRWPGADRDDWWIGKAVLMGSDWDAMRKL